MTGEMWQHSDIKKSDDTCRHVKKHVVIHSALSRDGHSLVNLIIHPIMMNGGVIKNLPTHF